MFALIAAATALAPVRDVKIDGDWEFHRVESGSTELYTGPAWEHVNLPHSAKLIDEQGPKATSFQGIVWYRKALKALPDSRGKRVVLKVEAAMQVADYWVNGKWQGQHKGGYLPFEIDLSKVLGAGQDATVLMRLDNRDHPEFNPGRSQRQLDFTYAGGLYRNVWLEVTEPEHIEDVYATAVSASRQRAVIDVQVTAQNVAPSSTLKLSVYGPDGKLVARTFHPALLPLQIAFELSKPFLWDLDHPWLYRVVATLSDGFRTVNELQTRFGIRDLVFDNRKGLSLNGRPLRLEGSNRHMAFPVVGNAASDGAQYREAKLLKSLGLNILRLAHYPQSPAFLDACDEVGLLVIDPIPGWQFFRDTPEFKEHVLDDVRQTVLRDRNHPCVAIFETCLNETYNAPDAFWRSCSEVAHEAFAPGQFYTGGDSYGKRDYSHPIWDVPWTGWDDATFTRPALFKGQKGVDREYGDYEFGGEQSTSRAGRGDGEGALMLQAWNFIWSDNRNRGNPWSYGDLTWEAIDARRGMSRDSPISKSGLVDLYRLPKPVAGFYQSQGLPHPFLHIANQWSSRPSPTKVVVFSNCDEVALLLNGKEVARRKPDDGPTTGYIGPKVADPLYWAHGKGDIVPATSLEAPVGGATGALPFSGGNCRNLAHPPFTFEGVPYRAGELKAVGYRHGKPVARDRVITPLAPDHLKIEIATQGRPLQADGSDFVFVYVSVVDRNGQVVPDAEPAVSLSVQGAAELLSGGIRSAEAGIAPFMVRAKTVAGKVVLTARADGFAPISATFESVGR